MISKATLTKIASLLKIKVEDLEAAQKAETETDITIDEGLSVYTADELTQLKNNEYKSGKEKGTEMLIKEAKEKHGLEFQGKTIDGLLGAYANKAIADANIEPSKKVQELEGKLANIQKTVGEYETKLAEKDKEVNAIRDETEISSFIPAPSKDGVQYSPKEVIQLMKINGYDFKREQDGKLVAYKDGQPILNKLSAAEETKAVISKFMAEKKLIAREEQIGGHGGRDQTPGGKITSFKELKQSFEAQGKSVLGEEFAQAVKQAQQEFPEFDMAN